MKRSPIADAQMRIVRSAATSDIDIHDVSELERLEDWFCRTPHRHTPKMTRKELYTAINDLVEEGVFEIDDSCSGIYLIEPQKGATQ